MPIDVRKVWNVGDTLKKSVIDTGSDWKTNAESGFRRLKEFLVEVPPNAGSVVRWTGVKMLGFRGRLKVGVMPLPLPGVGVA